VAKITTLKTRQLPVEQGESYDPRYDKDPVNAPAPERDITKDYPFERERRRKLAYAANLPEGRQYVENQVPTFREDLARLIGRGPADFAVDWTPLYGADWFDRMNYATMGYAAGNSPSAMAKTGAEGAAVLGAGALLKKGWNASKPLRDRISKGMNWFDDPLAFTKLLDASGRPLTVYRGEHGTPPPGGGFHSRTPNSLTFGTQNAANIYAEKPNVWTDVPEAPRVTPAHLDVRNPIINNPEDPFVDLVDLIPKLGDETVRKMALRYADSIQNTNNWEENFAGQYGSVAELLQAEPHRLNELYLHAHDLLDDPEFVDAAKAKGFDSAIHMGTGETFDDPEYRIFDPSQFVSPYRQPNQYALPKTKRK
jgi:hypothetical protein